MISEGTLVNESSLSASAVGCLQYRRPDCELSVLFPETFSAGVAVNIVIIIVSDRAFRTGYLTRRIDIECIGRKACVDMGPLGAV